MCKTEQIQEYEDAVELTRRLIGIESSDPGSYEGNIGDFIVKWLSAQNISCQKDEVMPGRWNVMARLPGEEKLPAMVFICHMDTVVLGEGWTKNPLGAEQIDGRIYGRGACDMKSGLACALTVFAREARKKQNRKHSLVFIGTVDEEDYMRGVERVIKKSWVRKQDWILDMEPTNGQIQVAHKGRLWFELEVQGITAHASTPWKGADAIAAISEMIAYMRKAILDTPVHEDLGASTVTFGMIQGGYRPYVVPDHAKVTIDLRLVPPTDTKKAVKLMEAAIALGEQSVPGVKGSYTITGDRPYVEKDEDSPLLSFLWKACEKATGKKPEVRSFPGYTDTAVIAGTLQNHNCMSYGPGNLEMAHKPDEYVDIEDIWRCEKVLEQLVDLIEEKDSCCDLSL